MSMIGVAGGGYPQHDRRAEDYAMLLRPWLVLDQQNLKGVGCCARETSRRHFVHDAQTGEELLEVRWHLEPNLFFGGKMRLDMISPQKGRVAEMVLKFHCLYQPDVIVKDAQGRKLGEVKFLPRLRGAVRAVLNGVGIFDAEFGYRMDDVLRFTGSAQGVRIKHRRWLTLNDAYDISFGANTMPAEHRLMLIASLLVVDMTLDDSTAY